MYLHVALTIISSREINSPGTMRVLDTLLRWSNSMRTFHMRSYLTSVFGTLGTKARSLLTNRNTLRISLNLSPPITLRNCGTPRAGEQKQIVSTNN